MFAASVPFHRGAETLAANMTHISSRDVRRVKSQTKRTTTVEIVVRVEDFPGWTVCTCVFVFALNLVVQFFTAVTAVLFATQVL